MALSKSAKAASCSPSSKLHHSPITEEACFIWIQLNRLIKVVEGGLVLTEFTFGRSPLVMGHIIWLLNGLLHQSKKRHDQIRRAQAKRCLDYSKHLQGQAAT